MLEGNMESVKCSDCGTVYSDAQSKCPQCGSIHRIVEISLEPVAIELRMKVEQVQGKNPHLPSRKKKRWEVIDKDTIQRGDGKTRVHHFQYKDRDLDIYEETVTDLETGEIIHACKEPLSEHIGHGSDKFSKKEKNS